MVKTIVKDPLFLAQKSVNATEADKRVVTDLHDTLRANLDHCVGMAANMIGVKKNIIVVGGRPFQFAMINPVIKRKSEHFRQRKGVFRWKVFVHAPDIRRLRLSILTRVLKSSMVNILGWTAQIIQHEIDHCNGIVI